MERDMATDTKTDGGALPPDSSTLQSQVSAALGSADTIAAGRVQQLQRVYQARASQLSRTASALTALYGANDSGVKAAEASLSVAKSAGARVAMVHRQITTAQPTVTTAGWVIHGRVFDANLKPLAGFTVFLVDATKAYQQAYGFAFTDDTGYFRLGYEGGATSSEASAAGQPAASGELFVEVADLKARPVFLSATALLPVKGTATYQNIVLSSSQQPLGDLPADIRKVAAPKRKPKKK
jgi:hypothetical protein